MSDNGDEVARQRRKRASQGLDRAVAGFDDLTLRTVLTSVVAATEESPAPLDVEQFLTDRGHVWQTVEAVLVCLNFVDEYVESPEPPSPSADITMTALSRFPPMQKEAAMTTETTDIDEQVLLLRTQSQGFGKIATTLGLDRAHDANEAFNRALRRRPAEEQASIRSEENGRLDRLAQAISANPDRAKDDVEKRLRAVERLRLRLMTD